MKLLAGDIGGTNTRLAFYETGPQGLQPLNVRVFPSKQYKSFLDVVEEFVDEAGLTAASTCFGMAGPVIQGRGEMTNLAWTIDATELADALHCPSVSVVNDLAANAHGIALLKESDLATLQSGTQNAKGNLALISAGTGLGEAGLIWDGESHRPFASEGGHCDFAPRNAEEAELLLYLKGKFGRVSYERVLSGVGLHNIYEFLRDTNKGVEQPFVREQMARGDAAAVISGLALDGKDPLCTLALDWFVSIYGAEAGNLALKFMATGGVFLGGGIAPKIAARLRDPIFLHSFGGKGRLSPLLASIPLHVILNDQTALLGAARCAAAAASSDSKTRQVSP